MASEPIPITDPIKFGDDFELDLRAYELRRGGRPLKLSRIPMDLLVFLVEHRGALVTREQIIARIWGKDVFLDTDGSINSAIRRLRQILKDDPEQPRFIQTVSGRGYRFIAPISEPLPKLSEGASPQTAPAENLLGKKISHYRVLELVGGGGMGVVYKAEDLKLGRLVALKFLPSEVNTNATAFERLQREARAASALDHPNICPIYQLGEHEAHPFIVMPLLEGQTLREWIEGAAEQNTAERVASLVDLAVQIADGLDAAHKKGIIHRDIKPANIFVTSRGQAKILDFGVAQFNDGAELSDDKSASEVDGKVGAAALANVYLTRTGMSAGTPSYLSPEQIRREKLDARTDLFSFGLVLYEMATGQRAFPGSTAAVIRQAVLSQTPQPPRQIDPGLPAELEKIVSKSLEKDLEKRYQSATELLTDLQALRAPLHPVVSEKRKTWLWVSAGAVLAALVIVGASLSGVRERLLPRAQQSMPLAQIKTRRSVAVLGFKNLSGKPEDEWISTALTEMVSAELAAGQQIRAIPGENVAAMKIDISLPEADSYSAETLSRIRQNLGTDLVVYGSYLAMGNNADKKIRIDLQSQDAVGGEIVAVISQNGAETDLSDLASRGGASLREKLGIGTVSEAEAKQVRATLPENSQAAQYYSEGLAKLRFFDALGARALLEKAVAAEPRFALAHSALAEALSFLGYDAGARQEAKTAFNLSQDLPREARLSIEARYREMSHDFLAAIENYQTLYNFFPDNLDYGLRLAETQSRGNHSKDSMVTIARLRALPPPANQDARIDLQEGRVAQRLSDYKRELQVAAAASEKGRQQGATQVVASARLLEGWAWEHLGDVSKSVAALSEARELVLGKNPSKAARAELQIGHNLYDKGDFTGARKSYEQALREFRETGDQLGTGQSLEGLGNVLYDQGRPAEAKKYYEADLAINKEIGDQPGIAGCLGSLANAMWGMSDLPGAVRSFEEAEQVFHKEGDKRGEATSIGNLGMVLIDQGNLTEARRRTENALALQQEIGYKRGQGFSYSSMAEIFRLQDRLDDARKTEEQAIALRKEIEDEDNAADSQVQLARIALEQGRMLEAESLARSMADAFARLKLPDRESRSSAVLSAALLAQGKNREAQSAAERAVDLAQKGTDRPAQFAAVIALADTNASFGKLAEATKALNGVHVEASRYGYTVYDMEARLRLSELERKSKAAVSQARLEQLQEDAQAKGLLLIARKANAALAQQHSFKR